MRQIYASESFALGRAAVSSPRRAAASCGWQCPLVWSTPSGKVVLDPDAMGQQTIRHPFSLFARTGSPRAVVQAFNDECLSFSSRAPAGTRKGQLTWAPLRH